MNLFDSIIAGKFSGGGSGGSGGVSSWNDLTDKPFGEYEKVVISEREISFAPMAELDGMTGAMLFIEGEDTSPNLFGNTIIRYNGVDYACHPIGGLSGGDCTLGNMGAMDPSFENTGEPFAIIWAADSGGSMWVIVPLEEISTATISVRKPAITPLDPEYYAYPYIDFDAMGLSASSTGKNTITVDEDTMRYLKRVFATGVVQVNIGKNGNSPFKYMALFEPASNSLQAVDMVFGTSSDYVDYIYISLAPSDLTISASVRRLKPATF